MPYKLRQSLKHHTADIRALCVLKDTEFVSSSRDRTSILWESNPVKKFQCKRTLIGHKNYVSSCCFIKPSADHPNGLIATGSHDNSIFVYEPLIVDPICIFSGHTNTVSTLLPLNEKMLASGSWDSTIKIWSIVQDKCIATIKEHEATVFSIIIINQMMVSASADKSINVYPVTDFQLKQKLLGHTDCVRDLAPLKDNHFLSCSNDGTIRRWNAVTGMYIGTLFSQNSFLYSIAAFDDASLIACGSEDNSLIILNTKGGDEILKLPALTVWSVGVFPNRDIITGSSDGCIRIFSDCPNRQATLMELVEYEEQVKSALNQSNVKSVSEDTNLGSGMKVSDLPGTEALIKQGKTDGQIMIINENGKVMCYQWSASLFNWVLVGDVTGTNGNPNSLVPSKSTSKNKVLYEGKEYDFVFSVDVMEDQPPLKLPYNIGSNPYTVAEDFLIKHSLPAAYLMDVVNFLNQNAGADQFINSQPEPGKPKDPEMPLLFPKESFLLFDSGDIKKIKFKLIEFVKQVDGYSTLEREKDSIDNLIKIAQSDVLPTEEAINRLIKCLNWPQDYTFPALDILRLAIRHANPNAILCDQNVFDLLRIIKHYTNETSLMVNSMLATRVLANMVLHRPGQDLAIKNKGAILDIAENLITKHERSPALETAVGTLILNMIILLIKRNETEILQKYFEISLAALPKINSKESILRMIIGIGTAIDRIENINIDESFVKYLDKLSTIQDQDELLKKISYNATKLVEVMKSKHLLK